MDGSKSGWGRRLWSCLFHDVLFFSLFFLQDVGCLGRVEVPRFLAPLVATAGCSAGGGAQGPGARFRRISVGVAVCIFKRFCGASHTHTHPTKQQIIHSTGGGDDAAFPSPSLTIHITPSSYSLSSLSSSFSLASSSSPADRLALLGPEQTALN